MSGFLTKLIRMVYPLKGFPCVQIQQQIYKTEDKYGGLFLLSAQALASKEVIREDCVGLNYSATRARKGENRLEY